MTHSESVTPAWNHVVPSVCLTGAFTTRCHASCTGATPGVAHARFDSAHGAQRELDADDVGEEADGPAPAQMIDPGEQRHDAHQSRPKRRCGDPRLVVGGPGRVLARRALHGVALVLGRVRLERRKLDHLMALRVRVGRLRQRRAAVLAVRREDADDVIDLGERQHRSPCAPMPGLPTAVPARALLGGLASLVALRARRGCVRRRRPRRVARVAPQLLAKQCDPRLERRDQRPQFRVLPITKRELLVPLGQLRFEFCDP